MVAPEPALGPDARRPGTGLPGPRFAARPSDLDIDFADPDRAALACRTVAAVRGLEPAEVAGWTLDRRLRALADIARATFGNSLAWQARCPACREPMELELGLEPLLATTCEAGAVECAPRPDTRLSLRLPTGLDQQSWRNLAVPREELPLAMARSLVQGLDGGIPDPDWRMPEEWLDAVEAELAARDPLGMLEAGAQCPSCGTGSAMELDLEAVILDLLAREQRRVMEEVHRLARTYHWSEAEVLAIPPRRRAFYLRRSESEW
ncbi:MAG TPA: hypothetical protein VFP70_13210 [Burkholderiales bacterium]|nr:hypothetical protein [Burkholderiales bacterium]